MSLHLTHTALTGLAVSQANDYFPFGLSYTPKPGGLQPDGWDNKFKYNGKEEQEVPGGWLDYGARFYDPALARWHSVDPLADDYSSYSSYNYTLDNPINLIDPNGLWVSGSEAWNLMNQMFDSEKEKQERKDNKKKGEIDTDEAKIELAKNQNKKRENDGYNGATNGGGLDPVSTVFGATGVAGSIASTSNSTFRLTSGANGTFSPKLYGSGWKGGSPARIATYSVYKIGGAVSFGSSVTTTANSYYDIATGQQQPITYVDATVGTAGIMSSVASYYAGIEIPYVGEAVAVYGTLRLTWDVFFNLGANYGPSKWYGDDDIRWFK